MIKGPAGAFQLVSVQMLSGTFVLLWFTQIRWRIINRGYFRSTAWVLWPLVAAVAFVLPSSLRVFQLVFAGAIVLYLLAVYSQRPLLEWITGTAAAGVSLWVLYQASVATCSTSCSQVLFHVFLGAAVLGAVTHGMVLGHWYLNQARLPIDPLKQATWLMLGVLGVSAIVGQVTRGALLNASVPGGLVAMSAATYWWAWALMIAGTVGLGLMVRSTVWARSTQSATGLLYIAIVTALAGQFILDLLVASHPV